MIKLSTRLQVVYDFIPKCSCLADIGCDHGYLSIAVAESGLSDKVIAMDINKGPLESAKANILESGLSDRISTRLSNGLDKLVDNEADVICICGMGGLLMKRIIDSDLLKAKHAKTLILEPQSEYMELRSYLDDKGFLILDEDLVTEENKIYPVLKLSYVGNDNKEKLSELELKFGPHILKKKPELFGCMLNKSAAEAQRIKDDLQKKIDQGNNATPILNRVEELNHELSLINEALSILGGK